MNTSIKLPSDLPECECFSTDALFTLSRTTDVAIVSNELCGVFHQLVQKEQLCSKALPYLMELVVITVLAYVTKAQGPALEYGSEDLERETERLLGGLESRVLKRSREMYARGRESGLTEAVVDAMREREKNKGEMQ